MVIRECVDNIFCDMILEPFLKFDASNIYGRSAKVKHTDTEPVRTSVTMWGILG